MLTAQPTPPRYGIAVDDDRAKELLAQEREQDRGASSPRYRAEGTEEGEERIEPGDTDSEGLYQDELDAGRIQDLNARLAAVDRAEARVAAGTYGVSTISGDAIPDAQTRSASRRPS